MEVLRDGDRWLLKPFADRAAGTEKAPTFSANQLQKRNAPAPQFSLPDLNGQLHALSSPRGRCVLLNFWGTWCPGCIDELPALKELGSHYTSKLDVIGIALNDKRETLQKFVGDEQLPYVVLVGGTFDDRTAREYNVDSAPTNVVIDPEGQVRFVGISLKAAVEAVLALPHKVETDGLVDEPEPMGFRNLVFPTKVIEKRFGTSVVSHHDHRPPRMSIRQYMKGMFLCTAPHLVIRVTFSTPTSNCAVQDSSRACRARL